MDLSVSGLASGFDWKSLVEQLADVERAPQSQLLSEQNLLQQRNNAYGSIITQLGVLRNRVDALKSPDLFNARTAASGDSSVASATASAGAVQGTFTFNFLQLATASKLTGSNGAGRALSASSDVSGLVLSSAGFSSSVSAGDFTVNGKRVSIATTDTLQQVFDKISTATGGTVTGSYNSSTDKISLTSGAEIVLGSAADSSNFLQVARLNNNGTATIASSSELGSVQIGTALSGANFATAVSDGGSGAGQFKINGVLITFNAATDTAATVLKRINDSAAGVTASYDSVNDRFLLANKSTGDIGVALEDVTGNFLAATGLVTGTLNRGQDLIYNVNGGGQLTSHSNAVTQDSHGIAGLTVNALKGAESITGASQSGSEIGFPNYISSIGGVGTTTRVRTSAPHLLETGYAVKIESSGTLPSQLVAGQMYYVRRVSTTDLRIFNTAADAAADVNAINFGNTPSFTGNLFVTRLDPLVTPATTTLGPPASVSITVGSDTSKIKTAINDFITEYNGVQSRIDSLTASSTDAKGKVTAGILASDSDANDVASQLRSLAYAQVSGLSGTLKRLESLGIATNSKDNTLKLEDSTKLDAALANNLIGVSNLFSDPTYGIGTQLDAYLERTIGEDGSLLTRQTNLTKQSQSIDTQIALLEKNVQVHKEQLTSRFVVMESAQAQVNRQLQYLSKYFS